MLQENIGFDPFQSKDDRISNSKDGIADRIAIVQLLKPNGSGESRAQFDPLEKLLQKIQPTVVG